MRYLLIAILLIVYTNKSTALEEHSQQYDSVEPKSVEKNTKDTNSTAADAITDNKELKAPSIQKKIVSYNTAQFTILDVNYGSHVTQLLHVDETIKVNKLRFTLLNSCVQTCGNCTASTPSIFNTYFALLKAEDDTGMEYIEYLDSMHLKILFLSKYGISIMLDKCIS
ncbi:hypothetical protein [Candidatus Fokinia crypta]|uniref:Uncharacterized protein n=1 Tax=Candidatus Fokinia crypta TaxID=1920990 RepID=A0ABZ0URD7_9RICK|nr:hypothetical protein [Candidatus Fokinia cryptica]WPX98132.1 hypothetical protein Fokcrypt_00668 [Candidatus Fokinia cryptica]